MLEHVKHVYARVNQHIMKPCFTLYLPLTRTFDSYLYGTTFSTNVIRSNI